MIGAGDRTRKGVRVELTRLLHSTTFILVVPVPHLKIYMLKLNYDN